MNQFDEYYSAIDEIIDCLKKDLYGVSNETELIEDIAPTSYYILRTIMRIPGRQVPSPHSHQKWTPITM